MRSAVPSRLAPSKTSPCSSGRCVCATALSASWPRNPPTTAATGASSSPQAPRSRLRPEQRAPLTRQPQARRAPPTHAAPSPTPRRAPRPHPAARAALPRRVHTATHRGSETAAGACGARARATSPHTRPAPPTTKSAPCASRRPCDGQADSRTHSVVQNSAPRSERKKLTSPATPERISLAPAARHARENAGCRVARNDEDARSRRRMWRPRTPAKTRPDARGQPRQRQATKRARRQEPTLRRGR
jgi:hypothetical protein